MVWRKQRIDLPLCQSTLLDLILEGAKGTQSHYCHWQIVEWCAAFCSEMSALTPQDPTVKIADDIVVQWELYLSSQYTLEQLDCCTPADMVLPRDFFQEWHQQLLRVSTT